MTTSDSTQSLPASMKLVKLSDADMTVADPAEDIRGRTVVDTHGEEVGKVDELLMDEGENKVRFLRLAAGGFLGIGETKFLIPVDAVSRVSDEAVHIDQTREHVAGAPQYDPELTYEPPYYGGLYGYYGYAPYWTPGYMYPMYPYYYGIPGTLPPRVPR
jgi:sporulation protein YlmC with PRC-barrel domain